MGSRTWRVRLNKLTGRLAEIGGLPSDPPEVRVRKAALMLLIALILPLATVWVVTYGLLGLWMAAAIPFAYQVVSIVSFATFVRTKRFEFLRTTQLMLMLFLPFLLQWTLGGFRASSAVALWAIAAPMGALVFLGPRRAWPWFAGFLALLVFSTVLEFTASGEAKIPEAILVAFFFLNTSGLFIVTYLVLHYFVRERERAIEALDREHRLLQVERNKSERLLLNVLPGPIAARLKEREEVIADAFPEVTVLFADIVGFTAHAERTAPDRIVQMLNELFSEFDLLAEAQGLEKIKTIGDAYMVAGGLPEPIPDHASAVVEMALGMLDQAAARRMPDGEPVSLRIGIDSGPVVAGVIGRRKFIYDLWGDTVNIASRMESHGVPGRIQVTERTKELLCDRYTFEPRGRIEVKGKGEMATYFLTGRAGG